MRVRLEQPTSKRHSWYWKLGIVSGLAFSGVVLSGGGRALAQITPDSTLGTESSIVVPNYQGLPVEAIAGNDRRSRLQSPCRLVAIYFDWELVVVN